MAVTIIEDGEVQNKVKALQKDFPNCAIVLLVVPYSKTPTPVSMASNMAVAGVIATFRHLLQALRPN